MYQFLADMVLLAHLAFIIFVLAGGLLLLRWPWLGWLHIPAMIWAVYIELSGRLCPLTPLENYFRALAGSDIYHGDFIARYLLPLVYPAGLTPSVQLLLAGVVIVWNGIIYALLIRLHRKARQPGQHSSR